MNDELQHYGILGMKWGKRKAKRAEAIKERVEARKNRADAKVTYLQKTKPNSTSLAKAKIKATKIKNSRYGQTNGQILAENIINSIGIKAIGSIASKTATALGKETTARTIEGLTFAADLGNDARTAYKYATNYKPKKK